jgi:hypothetical protein
MILYDTHPTSMDTASVIDPVDRLSVLDRLTKTIRHRDNNIDDISALLNDASIISAMISMSEYKNILVLPTPVTEERLRNRKWEPTGNSGDLLFPIIHEFCGGTGKVSVAVAKEGHLYEDAWKEFNVNTIPVDNWFSLDTPIKGIRTSKYGKFDAVVMIGNRHSHKTGTFKSLEVRFGLRDICTPDFDLIDVYRQNSKSRRIITGKKQDLSILKQRFVKYINTGNRWGKIYSSTHKLPKVLRYRSRSTTPELFSNKRRLTHFRLNHNIEQLETFYKVFK